MKRAREVRREGVGHVYASGAFPVVRRDHSLGFAMVWGVAQHLNGKKLGIIHFDRDCLDAAFVPGTGWPESGGFMPGEVLKFLQIIADAKPRKSLH